MTITVTTANLNGIRAAERKGFEKWVQKHTPDVLCLQELRAPQDAIDSIFEQYAEDYKNAGKIAQPEGLSTIDQVSVFKGRAGVGELSSLEVLDKRVGLPGDGEDADTGRWTEMDVKTPQGYVITVCNLYNHAGNMDDPTKMEQKYHMLDAIMERAAQLRDEAAHGGKQSLIVGDFNIAHTDLDIKDATTNETHSGFSPKERAYITKLIDEYEFVDVVRDLAGDIQGPYTWWSNRGRAFENNVGWRIDYQFATPEIAQTARGFEISRAKAWYARWSDHAPLTVTYDV
ncbi:exodeoxyribonuclease III [Bifidobacterium gallicum]|uniref:Exodeoxyribonuclease III n=1 Tax=Bifidobacterium gallicum DSM 20093 = LMG 11596 TaxID=561180 RepID=D1NT17_9BIFI|nr:exodeoxyribonuclease III [Bifidobacterium gallicum]EFA23819.1 putative exodeoxyribonuclease III [Bifidobacterium gallicum DSM 20093 = LMG 11596]KFI59180.1 exodeoxyribonuclease III [Bifidobacterium gallicum DSM 20093 = LMG 11596]